MNKIRQYGKNFWPLLIIVSLWLAFSSPYWMKQLVPFPSTYLVTFFAPWSNTHGMPVKNNAMPDIISQIYPWKKITIDIWKSGQVPLWNPYAFSGTKHAGNYQTAVFSPMNVVFAFLPMIDAWSMLILFQPLLAGMGMYLLLRAWGKSNSAITLGATAFMFCGFMTTWMGYGTLGYAAMSLPWIWFGITTWHNKSSVWFGIMTSLFTAWSLLSGHFQISLYVIASSIFYILWLGWKDKKWNHTVMELLFIALGIGIAIPQLWLTYDAYQSSTRVGIAKAEIIPWKYIVTMLAPDFYGNPVTRNDWFGHYAEWASYVGVIPFIFALFALTRRPSWMKSLLGVICIGSIATAYQGPVSDAMFALGLPVISSSAASRIMILVSFSLAALSAFGVDEMIEVWKNHTGKQLIKITSIVAIVVLLVWGVIFFGHIEPVDRIGIAKRNFLLPSLLSILAIGSMWMGCVKKFKIKKTIIIGICLGMLLISSIADIYRYTTKWMPFDPKEYVYPSMPIISYLEKGNGIDRIFGNIGNEAAGMTHSPVIEGYDAMYQAIYGEFINGESRGIVSPGGRSVVQFDKYGLYRDEMLALLGTKYILYKKADGKNVWSYPVWEFSKDVLNTVYEDNDYTVFENTNVFPRVWLASSYVIKTDPQESFDTLFAKEFDRKNSVVVKQKPTVEPREGTGSATINSYSANVVTIGVYTPTPKILVISDMYEAGWNVYIDGKKEKAMNVDYVLRGVALRAGPHTIQWKYEPRGWVIGKYISLACLGVLFGIGVYYAKKKNRNI